MPSFAQQLTLLRESKDLKKKDLAKILNVSAACVSQYENGIYMPGHDILVLIAQYFDVSVDFLLGVDKSHKTMDLNQIFYDNITYFDLLCSMQSLSIKNRKAILAVLDALTNS